MKQIRSSSLKITGCPKKEEWVVSSLESGHKEDA